MSIKKYREIVRKIDEKLLSEKPAKTHWYELEDYPNREMHDFIINEYSPHWDKVQIIGRMLSLTAKPVTSEDVLTAADINSMMTGKRRAFEWPFNRAGYFGVRRSYKKPKS